MNFLDWCLVAAHPGLRPLGLLAGLHHRRLRDGGPGRSVGWSASGWRRCCSATPQPSLWVSLGALFVVLVMASFGQAFLQYVGTQVRARITWQPIRAVDAVGGAALSVVAVLIVAWMLGVAISGSRIPGISPQVRDSQVLIAVNEVMPVQAQQAAALLRQRRRLELLPALPRAVRPRADRQGAGRPPAGCCATPTSATRPAASSRSAATTAAAAASRAPASSTPRTS